MRRTPHVIGAADVPPEIRGEDRDEAGGSRRRRPGTLKALKAQAERQIVLGALEKHDWHVTRTAEALGLADHSSLLKIMRRHGLSRGSAPGHMIVSAGTRRVPRTPGPATPQFASFPVS